MRATPSTPDAPAPSRARRALLGPVTILAVAAWVAGAATGLGVLAIYSTRSTPAHAAPAQWPDDTTIRRVAGQSGVVLFLHPRCPCSAATLAELSRVLARAGQSHETIVALYHPSSESSDWTRGPLRARAEGIPGVRIMPDPDGLEAARFGAVASGHAVAYDAGGTLRFQGGITASRGHEGDNLGADCLGAVLRGQAPAAAHAPTYGCEILATLPDAPCPLCGAEEVSEP